MRDGNKVSGLTLITCCALGAARLAVFTMHVRVRFSCSKCIHVCVCVCVLLLYYTILLRNSRRYYENCYSQLEAIMNIVNAMILYMRNCAKVLAGIVQVKICGANGAPQHVLAAVS